MNNARLQNLINVLDRAILHNRKLDMSTYISVRGHKSRVSLTESTPQINECGTTCCIAGFLCISSEWLDVRGFSNVNEVPSYKFGSNQLFGKDALHKYLQCDIKLSNQIAGFHAEGHWPNDDLSSFYGANMRDDEEMTLEVARNRLQVLLDTGK